LRIASRRNSENALPGTHKTERKSAGGVDKKTLSNSRKGILCFIRGILYFFGLGKNPVQHILDEYRTKSDAERLAGDWYKVNEDIQKVYGKETKD
jgi:hypothetical protein